MVSGRRPSLLLDLTGHPAQAGLTVLGAEFESADSRAAAATAAAGVVGGSSPKHDPPDALVDIAVFKVRHDKFWEWFQFQFF